MATGIKTEKNVESTMRDGTILRADVYRPDRSGPYPTILVRTPYDKTRDILIEEAETLARNGYAVMLQDIRGRFESEGEFIPQFMPVTFEAPDGYESVEWAAAQPWSNGKVGTLGNSYNAWTQWRLAPTRPPHLVAMWASGMGPTHHDWEVGGVFRPGRALHWLTGTIGPDTQRSLPTPAGPESVEEWELHHVENRQKWLWFLPWEDLPEEAVGGLGPKLHNWLANHHKLIFDFSSDFSKIDVPVFHRTGWYDRLVGTVAMFAGLRSSARSEKARSAQRLIVGPWGHQTENERILGEVDFGPNAEVPHMDLVIEWFDHWLKGAENGAMDRPPARLYVIGADRWRTADEWPPANASDTEFFLHSGGSANAPSGDGSLSRAHPAAEPSDGFTYDPRDPVMTLYDANGHDAPRDHRLLKRRRDILVYQTDPLERGVEICGYPKVTLWAASSAVDTDFIVRLIDVHPDGFAQNIAYGIVRARWRNGFERPEPLSPGVPTEFEIAMLPTSALFKPGHRIRLDVTSSDFPNFDRNHNTGGDDWRESALELAHQTVLHNTDHASRLVLPVID